MFRRFLPTVALAALTCPTIHAQEIVPPRIVPGVRVFMDVEIVGSLRVIEGSLVIETVEEHRGAGADKTVLKTAFWTLGLLDDASRLRFKDLEGKKVRAVGKGLFAPVTAYFLGVPIPTIQPTNEIRVSEMILLNGMP